MDFQAAAMLRLRPFFAIRGMRGVLISCWIVWGVPGFNGGRVGGNRHSLPFMGLWQESGISGGEESGEMGKRV